MAATYNKREVHNLTPHSVEFSVGGEGGKQTVSYESKGAWRLTQKIKSRDNCFDLTIDGIKMCPSPNDYTIDPLPKGVELKDGDVLIVSMIMAEFLVDQTKQEISKIFGGKKDIIVCIPSSGPEDCERTKEGQVARCFYLYVYPLNRVS